MDWFFKVKKLTAMLTLFTTEELYQVDQLTGEFKTSHQEEVSRI